MPDTPEIYFLMFEFLDLDDVREALKAFNKRVFDWLTHCFGKIKKLLGTQVLLFQKDHLMIQQNLPDVASQAIGQTF